MSPRLATTVESCTAAALSTDARDKYFLSYVGEGSPGGRGRGTGGERAYRGGDGSNAGTNSEVVELVCIKRDIKR